jgi:hypothetical protein
VVFADNNTNVGTKAHTDDIEIEAGKRQISYEKMAKIQYDKIPLKRLGQTAQIGAGMVSLTSDDAADTAECILYVNGGVKIQSKVNFNIDNSEYLYLFFLCKEFNNEKPNYRRCNRSPK